MLLAKDLLMASGGGSFPTDPVRFDYTGAVQTYTVPKGCTKIHVDAVGGGSSYACGGRVECDLIVTSEETYYVYIGQGSVSGVGSAFNGGGKSLVDANHLCGAGGTDIRTIQATTGSWYNTSHSSWDSDSSLLSRLVVAGAAGCTLTMGNTTDGGAGGGLVGGTDEDNIAQGGTQTSGGVSNKGSQYNGVFGKGGDAPGQNNIEGGGGGGWYGGAAGWGAGGGGSSYTHPSLCSNVVHTQGYSQATTHGWLIITPLKS